MNILALIFFALFSATIIAIYLVVRRRMAPPGGVAVVGVLTAVVSMTLFSLAQANILAHALLVGLLIGGGFASATLALAWYFLGNEMRAEYQRTKGAASQDS
jgi:hypothetical protein